MIAKSVPHRCGALSAFALLQPRDNLRALIGFTGVVAALTLAGGFWWRFLSRRRNLPCPAWLGWILENPYITAVAGSETLLDRADVRPGMRLLDVGAGTGRLTLPAADRVGSLGEVIALDVQPAMTSRIRERSTARGLVNVLTVTGRVEEANTVAAITSKPFDRALLVAVLGEIPNRETALGALYTTLGPGGLLSVTEVLPDPHYQTRSTVRALAEGAGFHYERTFGTPLAFTMNFRKPKSWPWLE